MLEEVKKSFEMGPDGKKLVNIIVLGLGFMFMFTAFQTCGNIEVGQMNEAHSGSPAHVNETNLLFLQQTIIKSFNSTEFHGSGYTR